MTHVIITAGPRDREAALAIAAALETPPYSVSFALPQALLAEANAFTQKSGSQPQLTPLLTKAQAIVVVWSRTTVRSEAMQEVARQAVVDGARLISVTVDPEPETVPYPNVAPIALNTWDQKSATDPAIARLFARLSEVTRPAPVTVSGNRSPKRLVMFCDGTWQSIGAQRRTNVAQAAMAVDRMDTKGVHQVTYYDDGVGAQDEGFQRFLVGATGRGLDNRILAAYRFLTLNYEHGDEIYLFGFSRGAYTVRSLTGLIRTCGILRREYAYREGEAMALYRRRVTTDSAGKVVALKDRDFAEAIAFRESFSRAWVPMTGATADPQGRDQLTVKYVGVWDTVGSLGIPSIWGTDKKYSFHDLTLGRWVTGARHAVALDETRRAFEAALWTNVGDGAESERHPTAKQLWFSGDHGGVGGGDGREGLSNVALLWLIEGAAAQGLSFKHSILDRFRLGLDVLTPPVRRFSLGSLVTYLRGWGWREGLTQLSEVHESALKRWAGKKGYRPAPLKRVKEASEADQKKPPLKG
jgi:uncharacterized protein (DUF2235 family)